jgi:hypothetical protein
MDKKIEEMKRMVLDSIAGFSFAEQAYMLGEIAERLKEEADICLEIEYGLHNSETCSKQIV